MYRNLSNLLTSFFEHIVSALPRIFTSKTTTNYIEECEQTVQPSETGSIKEETLNVECTKSQETEGKFGKNDTDSVNLRSPQTPDSSGVVDATKYPEKPPTWTEDPLEKSDSSEESDSGSSSLPIPTDVSDTSHTKEEQQRKPAAIRGRRTRTRQRIPKTRKSKFDSWKPLSELICRWSLVDMSFEIVLVVNLESKNFEICQNGVQLPRRADGYPIPQFDANVEIKPIDEPATLIPIFKDKPLIFKMPRSGGTNRKGRFVNGTKNGGYIVVTPAQWHRTDTVARAPDPCVDENFTAHHYHRDRHDLDAEDIRFQQYSFPLTNDIIRLDGVYINDDLDGGAIYIEKVPELVQMLGIDWVCVGEEKVDGWVVRFRQGERSLTSVLNEREGRFFIRVYDNENHLVDSKDFRYLRSLHQLRVDSQEYTGTSLVTPSDNGHLDIEVDAIDRECQRIKPTLPLDETENECTSVGSITAKASPSNQRVDFVLRSRNGQIDVNINLRRVWWRLQDCSDQTRDWLDQPISTNRSKFIGLAASDSVIQVDLPTDIRVIRIGFDDDVSRQYTRESKLEPFEIPLTDFRDYREIDEPCYREVALNVRHRDQIWSILHVSAEPLPRIVSFAATEKSILHGESALLSWETVNTELDGIQLLPEIGNVETKGSVTVGPIKTTRYALELRVTGSDSIRQEVLLLVDFRRDRLSVLQPHVKRSDGGWRYGKGFSHSEILAAGIKIDGPMNLPFRIDRRRRTTHDRNIDAIRNRMDA